MASTSPSPHQQGNGQIQISQKRPRPVLSCLECRRKKLRCDRLLPCKQCDKAGVSAQCTYNQHLESQSQAQLTDESDLEENQRVWKTARPEQRLSNHRQGDSSMRHASSSSSAVVIKKQIGVIEDLQYRVDQLERLSSDRLQSSTHAQQHVSGYAEQGCSSSPNHMGVLSIKGSRSRYHGLNHKITLLQQFDEAKGFIREASSDSSMVPIMNELRLLQRGFIKNPRAIKDKPLVGDSPALASLFDLLPPRHICDRLVGVYFYNHEKNLRILHIPTFMREGQLFWETPETERSSLTSFLPQLITVLAIALGLDQPEDLTEAMSNLLLSATTSCGLIDTWLGGLSGKHRVEISNLRTQALLLLAQQTRSTRVEEIWCATGALFRSAMTMGLHQEPSEFPNISIFQGEQRRRLWTTIVEMELQTSLMCGMRTMVREADYDCSSPANVDDMDLFEDMEEFPVSKPLDEWTDSSFQVALARSLSLRLQAVELASNIKLDGDYLEALDCGRKLEASLQNLPRILKYDFSSNDGNDQPGRLFGRVLLDIYVRRVLLRLYRPLDLASSREGAFFQARKACMRSSLIVLSHQDVFDPNVADLDLINSRMYWDLFHVICRGDIMQAALRVCLEIRTISHTASSPSAGILPLKSGVHALDQVNLGNHSDRNSTWSKASLTRTIENTLNSLLRRIDKTGSDVRDPLCLSVVLQSIRTDSTLEKKRVLMREGATNVLQACRQHLLRSDHSIDYGLNGADVRSAPLTASNQSLEAYGVSTSPMSCQDHIASHREPDFSQHPDIDTGEADFGFTLNWGLEPSWF